MLLNYCNHNRCWRSDLLISPVGDYILAWGFVRVAIYSSSIASYYLGAGILQLHEITPKGPSAFTVHMLYINNIPQPPGVFTIYLTTDF